MVQLKMGKVVKALSILWNISIMVQGKSTRLPMSIYAKPTCACCQGEDHLKMGCWWFVPTNVMPGIKQTLNFWDLTSKQNHTNELGPSTSKKASKNL